MRRAAHCSKRCSLSTRASRRPGDRTAAPSYTGCWALSRTSSADSAAGGCMPNAAASPTTAAARVAASRDATPRPAGWLAGASSPMQACVITAGLKPVRAFGRPQAATGRLLARRNRPVRIGRPKAAWLTCCKEAWCVSMLIGRLGWCLSLLDGADCQCVGRHRIRPPGGGSDLLTSPQKLVDRPTSTHANWLVRIVPHPSSRIRCSLTWSVVLVSGATAVQPRLLHVKQQQRHNDWLRVLDRHLLSTLVRARARGSRTALAAAWITRHPPGWT